MNGFRRRQAERSVEAWDEDKRGAQRFVESQPKKLRVQLLAVVDELATLGETPEPSHARVRQLLEALDRLVAAGVDEDVYRLAIVDAAVEYLK